MDTVNILWSGGWDSTFRLLQILIIDKNVVQPYYIIDPERRSIRNEFVSMENIKSLLFKKYPNTNELLLPTNLVLKSDILCDSKISESFKNIKKEMYFGDQYEWLASFCSSAGIKNMELSFEKNVNNKKYSFVLEHLEAYDSEDGCDIYTVKKELKGTDFDNVFSFFRWPLIEIDRNDMINVSKDRGFYDILNNTWFCHRPINNGTVPCGTCTPCIQAIEGGFAYRVPKKSLLRYRLRCFLKIDEFKKAFPLLYRFIKKILST